MAEQSPYEQDASHDFVPDKFHYFDIRSYDSEYLSACVGFAQNYGMYPDGLRRQQNTSFPYGIPLTLPPPFNQHHSNMIGHQYLGSSRSNGEYANPYISNTLADLNYIQHSHGNHPDR